MAITLAEAQKNVQDALQMGIIDEFRKSNWLWDNMTFDDAVSPTGGGATLTYAYTRLLTQPTAGFRAINDDYTPQTVSKQRHTVDLKVFGGAFEIDRVIANMGGIVNEVELQSAQKVKATSALWNDTVINGDSGSDANAFDGLEVALAGSDTEIDEGVIDLSTSANVTSNWQAFLDVLDSFLMQLDGTPSVIMGNQKLIAKLRAVARRAAMYQTTKDNYGNQVEWYGNIPFLDLGAKAGSNTPVVAIDGDAGTTSLYAARLGIDGFHGVSMAGVSPVEIRLPNFKDAGAVKRGDVEMVAAVALKATKAAGVLRNIKVQ